MPWTLEELISAFRCSFVMVQVLVVDDDVTARASMRRMLERHGYSVIVAECGTDALRLLERTHTPVDLLLTDVQMRDLTGTELVAALRERFPELPVVFVSADSGYREVCESVAQPVRFVEKPFLPAELIEAVQSVLGFPVAAPDPLPPAVPEFAP